MQEAYRGPYLKRAGEAAAGIVERLADESEYALAERSKEHAYAFEQQLFDEAIETSPGVTEKAGDIMRAALAEDQEAPFFFADYFIHANPNLSNFYESANGTGAIIEQPPVFESPEEVYAWIARLIDRRHVYGITTKDFLDVAKLSMEHYKVSLAREIVDGKNIDEIDPLLAEAMPLLIHPEKTLEQLQKLQRLRLMLRKKMQAYSEFKPPVTEDERLHNAKRALIEVYFSKVNAQVADYLPRVLYLYDQAQLNSDDDLAVGVRAALPVHLYGALEDTVTRDDIYRRLDFMRNGIDAQGAIAVDADGNAMQLPVGGVARRLWALRGNHVGTGQQEALFSAQDVAAFKAYPIKPEQSKAILEELFRRFGMLSGEPTDTFYVGRTSWAQDGRWQIVENPEKATYAVDSIGGVYKVPPVNTNLFALITTGGIHEFQHVWQAEADRRIGKVLRIAGIKGKRVSMLREGGANAKQRAGTFELFGLTTQTAPNMTYARARHALDSGEGPVAAVMAFYDEKMFLDPAGNRRIAAELAADRVVRLRRYGGRNSQPMSYAEEWLMIDELLGAAPEVVARATQVTCLDLPDQARLHRYGLLPDINGGQHPDATPTLLEVLRPWIDDARAQYARA